MSTNQNDDSESPEWRNVMNRVTKLPTLPDTPIEHDEGDEPETPADRVARLIGTLGAGARAVVKLYRIRAGAREWCGDYSPAAFETGGLGAIRDEWGAGEYEVVLYAERQLSTGKMHYGVRGRESINIATPQLRAPTPIAPGASPELLRMLDLIASGQQRMLEAIAAQRSAPAADPNLQMTQMFTMMKLVREAFGPHEAPKSTISEVVEAARMLRDVSGEFSPSRDEPSDPLTAALPGMIDLIGKSMQSQAPRPSAEAIAPVALPPTIGPELTMQNQIDARRPQPVESTQQILQPESHEMAIATLKMHLAMLIDLAEKSGSTDDAAGLVYERAPDEIIDLLAFPNWFTMLCQFEPKVEPHAKWFAEVAEHVARMMREDAAGEQS